MDNWTNEEVLVVKMILQKCHELVTATRDILPVKEKKFKNKIGCLSAAAFDRTNFARHVFLTPFDRPITFSSIQ